MSNDVERMLATRLEAIGEELREIRRENREDRASISAKIDDMQVNGCSKAIDHARLGKLEERTSVLEFARAKGLGVAAVVVMLIGIAVTLLTNWIAKHW